MCGVLSEGPSISAHTPRGKRNGRRPWLCIQAMLRWRGTVVWLVVLPLLPCRGRRLGGDNSTLDRSGGSDVAHGCAAFVLVLGVARSVGVRFISFPEMPHESCSAAAFSLSALASCARNKTVTIPGRMPALWRSFPSLVRCGSAFCGGYPLPQGPHRCHVTG